MNYLKLLCNNFIFPISITIVRTLKKMEILLEAGNRAGKVEASGISNLSLLICLKSLIP